MYGCSGTNVKHACRRLGIELKRRRKVNENENFATKVAKTGICLNCNKEYVLYKSHNGKFCSHECCTEYNKNKYISEWLSGERSGCSKRYKLTKSVREYLFQQSNYTCSSCGFNTPNPYTGNTILQIHHIDGDAANTSIDNLKVLCPNCHGLTENFGSRNKNKSARQYRREEYRKQEDDILNK